MIVVSQPSPTLEWIIPTTTTTKYEDRFAGRKRDRDKGDEEKQELTVMCTRHPNKRTKVEDAFRDVSNASNACIDPQASHEFLAEANDWKYEPLVEHDTFPDKGRQHGDLVGGDKSAPNERVDVERVIAILLQAMNSSKKGRQSPELAANSSQRHPTSPLSDSLHRASFVRKSVGGPCRGRRDPGLRRWVVCKNHIEDIRSFHPSHRPSEWVEALHEMGWEHLHPAYAFHLQQTTVPLDANSNSFDEWIATDEPRGHEIQT